MQWSGASSLDLRLHDGHRRPGDEPDVPARARLRRHPPRLLPRQLAHLRAALGDVRGRPDDPGRASRRRRTAGASAARMFTAVYFGGPDIEWWMRLPIFFFILLFFFFVGAAVATVYVRWKATGLVFFFIVLGFAAGRPDRAVHLHRHLGRWSASSSSATGRSGSPRGCSCRRRWPASPGSSSCGGRRRVPENRLTGPGHPLGRPGPVGIRMIDSRQWERGTHENTAPRSSADRGRHRGLARGLRRRAGGASRPTSRPTTPTPDVRSRPRPPTARTFTMPADCLGILPQSRQDAFASQGLVLLGGPGGQFEQYYADPTPEEQAGGISCIWGDEDVPESTVTVSVAPLTASTRGARRRQPDRPGPQRGDPRRRHQLRAARRREQRARDPQHHPRRQLGLGHRGARRRGVLRRGGRARGRGRRSGVHALMPGL